MNKSHSYHVYSCIFNKMPRSIVDDIHLVNVTNVVQYIYYIAHNKCLKLRLDKLTRHNFFKHLVSIQILVYVVCVSVQIPLSHSNFCPAA